MNLNHKPLRIHFDFQIFSLQRYGGVSRYFSELAGRLGRYGVDARIVAPFHINEYARSLPNLSGIFVPAIPRTGFARHALNSVLSRAVRAQPDIVHETYYSSSPLLAPGAARVVTVYDMIHERFSSQVGGDRSLSARKRDAVRRADHVICISETTRRDLIEIFDVPAEQATAIALAASMPRAATGTIVPEGDPFLLYVGERGGYKNFDRLLSSFAGLPGLSGHMRIVCFGGGEFSPGELERQRELGLRSGQVLQLSGNDSILSALYSTAVALVYPSVYEGFGIPPLEAMLLGCPVICSTGGSIPEVVGEAGEYFEPTDTDSIAQAICNVVESEARIDELRQLGMERSSRYTWDRCTEETARVYSRIVEDRRASHVSSRLR